MSDKRNALSYWFPKVAAAGLLVPRTTIIHMPQEVQHAFRTTFDGSPFDRSVADPWLNSLRSAASDIGGHVFLRTDYTSGKHNWSSACFVADPAKIETHVAAIIEYSEMVDLFGLPWGVWAVREMLPTTPVATCPDFGGMPVAKEFRVFVNGGRVECIHPYWPTEALEQGGCDLPAVDYAALCDPGDEAALRAFASRAGEAVGGRWSVDLLATKRGWFLTDMAIAEQSYHWPECAALKEAVHV